MIALISRSRDIVRHITSAPANYDWQGRSNKPHDDHNRSVEIVTTKKHDQNSRVGMIAYLVMQYKSCEVILIVETTATLKSSLFLATKKCYLCYNHGICLLSQATYLLCVN